jgi:hypothetical protein
MNQAASLNKHKNSKPFLIEVKSKKSSFNKHFSETNSNTSFSDDGQKLGKWTKEEDESLLNAVHIYGTKNWKLVSKVVQKRNQVQCLHRWTKILQPGLTKGPWSIDEDRKLMQWVKKEGPCKWTTCAEYIKGRSGKQCRERWLNTLNPSVKKGGWEAEEDYLIFKLYNKFGSQWSKISLKMPTRTENSIKNRFYSTLRRIAAEKEFGTNSNGSIKKGKSKLESLIKYVPDAIEEKTKNYLDKNNGQEFETEDNIVLIDCDKKSKLKKHQEIDLISPPKQSETDLNNICVQDLQKNDNSVTPKQSSTLPDHNGYLDNITNHYVDSFFESSSNENYGFNSIFMDESAENQESFSFFNNQVIDPEKDYNGNIDTIYDELNSLELYLQTTRKNLLTSDSGIF